MPHIQATTVVQILTSLFPSEALWKSAKKAEVVVRVRKVNVVALFWGRQRRRSFDYDP